MTRIKAGDLFLNYTDSGEGDTFMFIPGLTGILNAWDFQIPHFSKKYRCISFDHRGTGESDKPTNAYSTDLIANSSAPNRLLLSVNAIEGILFVFTILRLTARLAPKLKASSTSVESSL